jgi:hypothetical protein
MRSKEIQGLLLIIALLVFGVYSLFKYLFQTNFYLGLVIIIILVMGLLFYFNRPTEGYEEINTIHIDNKGYERDHYNDLVHRNVAYEEIYKEGYKEGIYTKRFGEYDVHHKDGNKRNNASENLQILTREEHKKIHGH